MSTLEFDQEDIPVKTLLGAVFVSMDTAKREYAANNTVLAVYDDNSSSEINEETEFNENLRYAIEGEVHYAMIK